jgi:hypothetical protein
VKHLAINLPNVKFAARRDMPVLCRVCGRRVERAACQQLYCSRVCRERGKKRSRKTVVQPLKIEPRYPPYGRAPEPP